MSLASRILFRHALKISVNLLTGEVSSTSKALGVKGGEHLFEQWGVLEKGATGLSNYLDKDENTIESAKYLCTSFLLLNP